MSQSGLGSIIQFNIAVSLTRGAGLSPAHLGEEASSLLWPSKRRSKRRQKVLHLHAFTSAPARRLPQHTLYRPSEMCQLSTASKQNIRVSLTPQTQIPKHSSPNSPCSAAPPRGIEANRELRGELCPQKGSCTP